MSRGPDKPETLLEWAAYIAIIILLLGGLWWINHDCDRRARMLGAYRGRQTRDAGCLAYYENGTIKEVR